MTKGFPRPKGYSTLAEHDAWLKSVGRYDEFLVQRARRQEEHRKRIEAQRLAQQPIVQALRAAGFDVKTVWDLVQTADPYPAAIPILLEHLQKPYPPAVREMCARALAVREAKHEWPLLKRLFIHEPFGATGQVKDGLAVVLAAIASRAEDEFLGEVIDLLRDTRNGPSRILMLSVLERTRDPRGKQVILQLATDTDLSIQIADIRKKWARNAKRRADRKKSKHGD